MESLSKKELEFISELEFKEKYYFQKNEVISHFVNDIQLRNTIYRLKKKGRILNINRDKYFLIPIKAYSGKWSDNPFIIADEMMNGKGYCISGWSAANYWRLTDQIPATIEINTNKRNGKCNILNNKFIFHKTTPAMLNRSVKITIGEHSVNMLSKEDTLQWLKKRDF
jgi:predicted transcriptional regulator of viral defense system